MEANDGLFTTIITLAVALWGAFLATYQWWIAHRERQITLKIWTYWTSTFNARLQNVSSSPVQIEEISLRGRFLAGLKQKVSRIRDEEFSISYPVTDDGTPLILEPQDAYVYCFDDSWDHLQEYEIARRRHRADGGPSTLAIRSLVVCIAYGDGGVCESVDRTPES